MDKISAALDSPIGRLVDNASPKIGAVTTMVAGTSWYMAVQWDNVVLITSAIGGVFFRCRALSETGGVYSQQLHQAKGVGKWQRR